LDGDCADADGLTHAEMEGRRSIPAITRVMVNCKQTGEAAGVAACLATRAGCGVREVDAGELRGLLADGGSIVL
jgi:hypothetical protein